MYRYTFLALVAALLTVCVQGFAAPELPGDISAIYRISDGPTKMVNGLWGENAPEKQFGNGRSRVVIADIKGPGIITMIHFALPQTLKLNRDTIMRVYWDGEKNPSVQSPLVDFFCDPNGSLDRVDSVLVNKKRGWNCYFPMPFAKSARIELTWENARYPNGNWAANPCYSYVMYRPLKSIPNDSGYFHAIWRQKTVKMGDGEEYPVFEAQGRGQFIGWNVSVRGAGTPADGYTVDENEKFYVDGEKEPSIEWQGLEDSFGYSWGFPEQANSFPYTGYQPYNGNGAAAFRFCINDQISFSKSIRFTVGFGKEELKGWKAAFPNQPPMQFSSVAYWYQTEPHRQFEPMADSRDREPVFWAKPQMAAPTEKGLKLSLLCGNPFQEIQYLADGWDFIFRSGYSFNGPPWTTAINHCWASFKTLEFDIVCPQGSAGTLKLFILDGDNFAGGRKQSINVAGRFVGTYDHFNEGRWIDVPISAKDTASGKIPVRMKTITGNAVVSLIKFIEQE